MKCKELEEVEKAIKDFNEKMKERNMILVPRNYYYNLLEKEKRIDKAIDYIKENYTNEDGTLWHEGFRPILSILGEKENE